MHATQMIRIDTNRVTNTKYFSRNECVIAVSFLGSWTKRKPCELFHWKRLC